MLKTVFIYSEPSNRYDIKKEKKENQILELLIERDKFQRYIGKKNKNKRPTWKKKEKGRRI